MEVSHVEDWSYRGTLYGTANAGGVSGFCTVFRVSLPPPQLIIIPSGSNVILTWRTNAGEFKWQSTTNLSSPAIWNPVSPTPVLIGVQNVVTNAILGPCRFYRLSQ